MPYSPEKNTRLRARQLQLLYVLHKDIPYPYADQITSEDISLANALEPCWTHSLASPNYVLTYPWGWVTKKGSLAVVLRSFRVKAKELLDAQPLLDESDMEIQYSIESTPVNEFSRLRMEFKAANILRLPFKAMRSVYAEEYLCMA
ncbi:hypothetical protein FBULB1_9115 [Fusarium bulbicola]|nr:hypothetical protein FBULB1_9115 [Fusarium bulbicola]